MAHFSDTTQFGLTMRFDVTVEGIDLGAWSSCDGLKVDFGLKEIRVGGNNDCRVYLPDRSVVSASRPQARDDSDASPAR